MEQYEAAEFIGIGCPGPLDVLEGVILKPTNFPDWDGVPLQRLIADATGKPVLIDNDANVAALAESLFGAGKGLPIVQYITLSTGVGGGLVINGQVVIGRTSSTGEIANIIIQSVGGYAHSQLNAGSFESLASGEALPRIAQKHGLELTSAADIFAAYTEGDVQARVVMTEYVDNIARGMQAIGQTLDPHIFVLGGGVMQQAEILLPLIQEAYHTYVYDVMAGTPIVAATLEEPGVVGAAFLGISRGLIQ